jgi:hypothetical protein
MTANTAQNGQATERKKPQRTQIRIAPLEHKKRFSGQTVSNSGKHTIRGHYVYIATDMQTYSNIQFSFFW